MVFLNNNINSKREYWYALGIFTLLTIVYFYPILLGQVISQTDFYYFISPWDQFRPDDLTTMGNSVLMDQSTEFLPFFLEAKSQIFNGLFPLWNPYIFAGTPLLANMQSALFFPLNIGHYVFDPAIGFSFSSLLKLILSAFFTYIYARKINLSHTAGIVSGIVFAYAMFHIFWLNHPHTNSTMLFPLSFYFAEQFLRQCNKKTVLQFALLVTATLFSGHVELTFLIAVATGIYLFVRAIQLQVLSMRLIYMFFSSYLIACILSAIILLPFVEFLIYSATWGERAENTLPPLPIGNSLAFFLGKIFVHESWIGGQNYAHAVNPYIGIVILPLIILAIKYEFKKSLAFIVLSVIAFLAVFNIVSFHSFLLLIPIVKQTPLYYFVIFFMMTGSIMAGIGLDSIKNKGFMFKHLVYATISVLVIIGLFVLYWDGSYYAEFIQDNDLLKGHIKQLALISLVLLMLALLLLRFSKASKVATYMFVLLVFIDLSLVGQGWNPTNKKEHVFPQKENEISEFFSQTKQPFRILSLQNVLLSSTNMLIKIEEVQGYDVPVTSRYHQFFKQALKGKDLYWHYNISQYDPTILPFLQILNVTHIISKIADLDLPLVHDGHVKIFQVPDAKQRAFMTYQSINANDEEHALRLTLDNKDNLNELVVLENNNDAEETAEIIAKNEIEFYSRTSQKIKMKVTTDKPGYMVLSQSYYPGWHAYVDDEEVEIYPADYLLQAIKVPQGSHQVRFVYQPFSFWFGLVISLLSFGIVLWNLKKSK